MEQAYCKEQLFPFQYCLEHERLGPELGLLDQLVLLHCGTKEKILKQSAGVWFEAQKFYEVSFRLLEKVFGGQVDDFAFQYMCY